MLTAAQVKELISQDAVGLSTVLNTSGYKGISFTRASFVGITNAGQFCYAVEYKNKTGDEVESKVFVTYNHANNSITADLQ